jgi:hypothetical protein
MTAPATPAVQTAACLAIALSLPLALAACAQYEPGPRTDPLSPTPQIRIDDQIAAADAVASQIARDLNTELLPRLESDAVHDLYIAEFRNLDPRTSTDEFDLLMRRIRRDLMQSDTFTDAFDVFEAPARMADIARAQTAGSGLGTTARDLFTGRETPPQRILVLSGTFTPIQSPRRDDRALRRQRR